MDFFDDFIPYDPLFDENHDGKIDWHEEGRRQDYEDFMNKRGVYAESDSGSESDPDLDLELAGLDRDELASMDADERNELLEDAGIDPDSWDD